MTEPAGGPGAASRSRAEQPPIPPARASAAAREIKVGVFVIAGVIAVVAALFLLTDPGTMRGRYHVTTVVPSAGGIRKGDPVQMRGVNIGRVRGFHIDPQRGVEVKLELENEYAVPEDSRVTLKSLGLLGGLVAEINPGRSKERLEEGDVLLGAPPLPGLEETAGNLGVKADTLLGRANLLLAQDNIAAVSASTAQLQTLMTELAGLATEQRRELAVLTASLRRSAQGVESAATRPELARAIARSDSITRRLDGATERLNAASTSLANITGRLDRGEGSMGKLLRDDALYDNLNAAAVELKATGASARALTEDIRANPKRYINVSVF
jgi:phospholipid/cholesterol/gamma-HCH transport system substrate-binding protein